MKRVALIIFLFLLGLNSLYHEISASQTEEYHVWPTYNLVGIYPSVQSQELIYEKARIQNESRNLTTTETNYAFGSDIEIVRVTEGGSILNLMRDGITQSCIMSTERPEDLLRKLSEGFHILAKTEECSRNKLIFLEGSVKNIVKPKREEKVEKIIDSESKVDLSGSEQSKLNISSRSTSFNPIIKYTFFAAIIAGICLYNFDKIQTNFSYYMNLLLKIT